MKFIFNSKMFFIISIIYLLIEIGFKGYAIQILGDSNVYPYEIEILEKMGRYVSSFGISLFIIGFIKKTIIKKISIFLLMFVVLSFAQKKLFDNIHIFASKELKNNAYHLNLYKSNFTKYDALEKFSPYSFDKKDEIEFRAFIGILPFLIADSNPVLDFSRRNEIFFENLASKNMFPEKHVNVFYDNTLEPFVLRNFKKMFDAYNEGQKKNFDEIYMSLYVPWIEKRIQEYYQRNVKARRNMPATLKAKHQQIADYKRSKVTPPRSLINATIVESAKEIKDNSYLLSSVNTILAKEMGVSNNINISHYQVKNLSYEELKKHYYESINGALAYNMTKYFNALDRNNYDIFDYKLYEAFFGKRSIKDIMYEDKTKLYFESRKGMFISDPKDIYNLIYNKKNIKLVDIMPKYINKNNLENKRDKDLQVKMILVPPVVLSISTFALILNLISVSLKLFSGLLNKYKKIKYFILSISLLSFILLPIVLIKNDRKYDNFFNNIAIKEMEIKKEKLIFAKWFINSNIILGKWFIAIEEGFMFVAYKFIENKYIENQKKEGNQTWIFNELKLEEKKNKLSYK